MANSIEHDGADWAGHANGYVCLHCKAHVSDAEWAAWLAGAGRADPEPENAPKPAPKPKAAKKPL